MTLDEQAIIIHDTQRILAASLAACALFRCEPDCLNDLDMFDLIRSAEFRQLAKLRMQTLRLKLHLSHTLRYDFIRCDGSTFCGHVLNWPIADGLFWSIIVYEYEVR